jgi:hypothetical protein
MFCPKCGSESQDDSQFCRKCGNALGAPRTVSAAAAPAPEKKQSVRPAFILGVVLVLVALGWLVDHSLNQNAATNSPPKTAGDAQNVSDFYNNTPPRPQPQPHTVNIGQGALSVAALHFAFYTLSVPAGAHDVHVQGHFQATGGTGNDIEVFLLNDEQFTNWKNGHATPTYYNSGKTTVGDVQTALPAGVGTYYLVFNNKFSALTAKAVVFTGTMVYYQ